MGREATDKILNTKKVLMTCATCKIYTDGELCYRGRHIMMGYMYDEEKTKGTFDDDGWLLSGDVGHMDEHGSQSVENGQF